MPIMHLMQDDQRLIQRLLYGWILLIWLGRAWEGLLLGQLADSPLLHVGANNLLWVYWLSPIPHWIQQFAGWGWLLDGLWLGAALWGCWRGSVLTAAVVVSVLTLNYYSYYIGVATHHEHTLLGILFCLPLLWVHTPQRFALVFAGIRYYVLWMMVSAAVWKIYRGSWCVPHQMAEILLDQHLRYLLLYPDAVFSQFVRWLVAHPALANLLWYLGWLIEGSFIIGFFTRRWDRWLGMLFLSFFAADYALMGINFWEFCIFAIVFYPWTKLWEYYYLNRPLILDE